MSYINFAPNVKPFTRNIKKAAPLYGAPPAFVQTSGVLPGQAPVVNHAVARGFMNFRAIADQINSVFNVKH